MGIEPTTSRTTISRSNQLSYTRHVVRLKGFEPLTPGLEGRCSIQLSYRCIHPSITLSEIYYDCKLFRKYSLHLSTDNVRC